MFTVSLGPLMANQSTGKLYVRGTIVDAPESLKQAIGLQIRAYAADSPDLVGNAGTFVEATFRFNSEPDKRVGSGTPTYTVHSASVKRVLAAAEAAPYEVTLIGSSLQAALGATPREWEGTPRNAGMASQADAHAKAAEAATADAL